MDNNIVSETLKSNRTRKPSISSDISESTDIDIIGTPKKRTTRSSLIAGSSGTPTKITRATTYAVIFNRIYDICMKLFDVIYFI